MHNDLPVSFKFQSIYWKKFQFFSPYITNEDSLKISTSTSGPQVRNEINLTLGIFLLFFMRESGIMGYPAAVCLQYVI